MTANRCHPNIGLSCISVNNFVLSGSNKNIGTMQILLYIAIYKST